MLFYDTPQLDLFQRGVVLRTRKVSDSPDEVTLEPRPVEASRPAPRGLPHFSGNPGSVADHGACSLKQVRTIGISTEPGRGMCTRERSALHRKAVAVRPCTTRSRMAGIEMTRTLTELLRLA